MADQQLKAVSLRAEVGPDGRVAVPVTLPPGTPVKVLILADTDTDDPAEDLRALASTNLDFWFTGEDDHWDDA